MPITIADVKRLKTKLETELKFLSYMESDPMMKKGVKEQKAYIKILKEIIKDWEKLSK